MKNKIKTLSLLVFLFFFFCSVKQPVYAHSLELWANAYSDATVNNVYFKIHNSRHIDGNIIYYHFSNNTTQTEYGNAFLTGIALWGGLISGVSTSSYSAHTTVQYKNRIGVGGILGETQIEAITGDSYHIRRNTILKDSKIVFYNYNGTYPRSAVAAHELGHLWGIADLYNTVWGNLFEDQSIYDGTTLTEPSRWDRNAMRIGIKDFWFETASVWCYNVVFGNTVYRILRSDVDYDLEITSADGRLILRCSVGLENFTDTQRKLADVDGDGSISAADAREVMRMAAGLIDRYPADG